MCITNWYGILRVLNFKANVKFVLIDNQNAFRISHRGEKIQ
jgi:hypothetical protein